MKLCFLVEERYRHDGMPREVIRQLSTWGHQVDVVRPGSSLMRMSETVRAGSHDAWVLKTVSGGPGLTLLEAAAAVGLTTVNDARSIRGVRDKAVAAAIGRSRGLPMPQTYAAARPEALEQIPEAEFPLVVKPSDGSSGRAVRMVPTPDRLRALRTELAAEGMLIAQPFVPNSGIDLKVYSVGGELYATERTSPLRPDRGARRRRVPLSAEVAAITAEVGAVYGLDLYGVDVLLGPDGPVIVDVNDFPSFKEVPDAAARVGRAVLELARRGGARSGATAADTLAEPSTGARAGVGVDTGTDTVPGTGTGTEIGTGTGTEIGTGTGTGIGTGTGTSTRTDTGAPKPVPAAGTGTATSTGAVTGTGRMAATLGGGR